MANNGNHGVGTAAKEVAEHASAITKLEVELATLELKKKAMTFGVGAGLGVGAAIFALFGLAFVLATATAALSLVVSVWTALLIMTGIVFLIAGLLGIFAASSLKRATPPVPEKAIREAKTTQEAIRR